MTFPYRAPHVGTFGPIAAAWLAFLVGCSSGSSAADESLDASPSDANVRDTVEADVPREVMAPSHVPRFPDGRPFSVERAGAIGDGPNEETVEAFTDTMLAFYADTDIFRWTRSISHGLADDNPWGEPPFAFWWQGVTVTKTGDVVTFVHEGGADNMMSHHGRVFGPLVGAFLSLPDTEDALLRELVLGYVRGVSATFTGSIWAEEDPVVPTIMARAIFHRDHEWQVPERGVAAVDYSLERIEEFERRHDTVHNPDNPTWGDIWVRNKRSKDDLPWVYRMQAHLARILWTVEDAELRGAALTLYDQLTAFAQDILDHDYVIRAKDGSGDVYIPYSPDNEEVVDDFASMVVFEVLIPNAECNAKLPVALIATGEPQGNDCGDGRLTAYEELGLARFYGHTWMQWNFHISAVATALLHGEQEAARLLVEGLGARMDALHTRDDHISEDPRFDADVAQTLVLAATYGMPLTGVEADLIITQYERAAEHYEAWGLWNLWDPSVVGGTYSYLPGRSHEDSERSHVHIEEMFNLFEYCASPVRATDGAMFFDCARFKNSSVWR